MMVNTRILSYPRRNLRLSSGNFKAGSIKVVMSKKKTLHGRDSLVRETNEEA